MVLVLDAPSATDLSTVDGQPMPDPFLGVGIARLILSAHA
jgi:hypothetical protein